MKRAIAVAALALSSTALPGFAAAGQDLSLQDPPGAPHIGTALCQPALPGGQLSCPAPTPDPAGPVAPVVESAPVAPPVLAPVPAPVAAPGTALSVTDPAYGARLHAELCAARPVFCEVDQSGKYINQ